MASQHVNIFDIFKLDLEEFGLVPKLQEWGALASEGHLTCVRCGLTMKLAKCSNSIDGLQWRCYNKVSKNRQKAQVCGAVFSLRRNTFFEKSRLSLRQIVTFCLFWCRNTEIQHIVTDTRMSFKTAINWNSFCREVAIDFCIRREQPIGGPNMTVEIDESKFDKTEYHRGHILEGQWVFGGVCRETGDMFLVPVERRGASTLISLIEKWILPGSTIISDCWGTYDGIDGATLRHLRVNHSVNFKDPPTGAHNTIKWSWNHAKCKLPGNNRKCVVFVGNLAKFMFLRFCRKHDLDATEQFFRAAGVLYNPYRDSETLLEENFEDETDGEVERGGEAVQPGTSSSSSFLPQASTSAVNVDSSDCDEDEENFGFF